MHSLSAEQSPQPTEITLKTGEKVSREVAESVYINLLSLNNDEHLSLLALQSLESLVREDSPVRHGNSRYTLIELGILNQDGTIKDDVKEVVKACLVKDPNSSRVLVQSPF